MSVCSKKNVGKQNSSDYKMTALQHYEKSKSFTETCNIIPYAFDKESVMKIQERINHQINTENK